jgi:hemerythrin-like domain-containing protein
MATIADLMTDDHRACDHAFARAETLAARGQWEAAGEALDEFATALEAHFDAEEEQLFPRFEAVTGTTGGPTQVMRGEHADMRAVLAAMREAMSRRDAEDFAGEAETLIVMLQQHNMKEEGILYPMCDLQLAGERDRLVAELAGRLAARTEA